MFTSQTKPNLYKFLQRQSAIIFNFIQRQSFSKFVNDKTKNSVNSALEIVAHSRLPLF